MEGNFEEDATDGDGDGRTRSSGLDQISKKAIVRGDTTEVHILQ